jgi:hypothetical protein
MGLLQTEKEIMETVQAETLQRLARDLGLKNPPTRKGEAGNLCSRAGATRLGVPRGRLGAFRTALKKMGYVLPQ